MFVRSTPQASLMPQPPTRLGKYVRPPHILSSTCTRDQGIRGAGSGVQEEFRVGAIGNSIGFDWFQGSVADKIHPHGAGDVVV